MDEEPEADFPQTGVTRSELGCRRVAFALVLGIAGFSWTTIAVSIGDRSLPAFGILAIAGLACFAAVYGLLTLRRWAPVVAVVASIGSVALAYVVYLEIRAAFATFPF